MISQLKTLSRSAFLRNVGIVATGSTVAQIISIAAAPVTTRLYGPEAFGMQGLFLSVVGLLSVVAALGYPTAIVLPKSETDAVGLARLSIAFGLLFSCITAVLLVFCGADILRTLNAEALSPYTILIPLAISSFVLGNTLSQWLIRQQAFHLASRFLVMKSSLLSGAKVIFGLFHPTAGTLIITNTFAGIIATALIYRRLNTQSAEQSSSRYVDLSPRRFARLASEYRDFPLLRTPQNLINAFSQNLPLLLLAAFFDASAAGHYALAIAMLGIPANLIGNSVMSVFYPRVNLAIQNEEHPRGLIIKATSGMALVGLLPFLALAVGGPVLFLFAFGDEWRTAGVYAQWLSPWIFLQFVNKPAVAAVAPLRLQYGLLIYELFSTGSKVLALWLGFYAFGSDIAAVAMFSILGVIAYLWLISWVIHKSTGNRQQQEAKVEIR